MKITLLTTLALIAFAGNSILCRLALGGNTIDASSFTCIRLLAGIVVLLLISMSMQPKQSMAAKGSWKASIMLFLYAATFSFAYVSLDTGTGALILFAAVQITMILLGVLAGNKLYAAEWLGITVAFAGFVYLVLPGVAAPSLLGFMLMSVSGVAWGLYTLMGKTSQNPLRDTTYNFVRTLPFVIVLLIATMHNATLSWQGIMLAALAGGITSGIGYTIWYIALGGLTSVQAAVLQLLVPVLAALGGVVFAEEGLSMRLILSSTIILGGILTVILGKHFSQRYFTKNNEQEARDAKE